MRLGDPAGDNRLQLMAWGRRRRVRWSKLHNRFDNVDPTPEASLAWDWEKLDAGVKLGLWYDVDLTVEYASNRIFLAPRIYVPSNETLATLRIRL